MAHIILFQNSGCWGSHFHAFFPIKNLNGLGFNDTASSFVILEGDWQFFKDSNYDTPFPLNSRQPVVLGPGLYVDMSTLGAGSNDSLSSLRPVQLVNGTWESLPYPYQSPAPVG